MYLVQIFLPLMDNDGAKFPPDLYRTVRDEFAAAFGGVTVYSHAPAQGIWEHHGGRDHDDLLVFEVMTDTLDHQWWRKCRWRLEQTFHQQSIVVRSLQFEPL